MSKLGLSITIAVILGAGGTALAASKPGRAERNQARLSELLEGREAGTPVSCIPQFQAERLEVIEGVAMVYGRGHTLYVARPVNPQFQRWNDIFVTRRTGAQACHNDIMRTLDRMTGLSTGVVFLDRFVPYRKPD
jgi:hypothetical protein